MEDRCDNQPASDFIRVGASSDRCFPRDLVRLPGGQYRDVVSKCGGRVAHDEVYCVSSLDRTHAGGDDLARFSRGLPCRGARRYHEPPPPVARHSGLDPGLRRGTQPLDLGFAHEPTPAARLHLCARPWRDLRESGLASDQHGTRSRR